MFWVVMVYGRNTNNRTRPAYQVHERTTGGARTDRTDPSPRSGPRPIRIQRVARLQVVWRGLLFEAVQDALLCLEWYQNDLAGCFADPGGKRPF